jgi:ATP-dependent Lon protease
LSYNNSFAFSEILRDRITEIKLDGFEKLDKLKIAEDYLIPKIFNELNINSNRVRISEEVVEALISKYTCEAGVRKLRENLYDIISDVVYQETCGKISRRDNGRNVTLKNFEKFMPYKIPVTLEKIHDDEIVGKINGLYASDNLGGIIPIHVSWIPSDETMKMHMTGNLGSVMKESTSVARTLAWNFLDSKQQKKYFRKWKKGKQGIHIHCSELSVEKEGPSAGTALTVALISLLLDVKVRRDVAITGEIDLAGKVMEIGGLKQKLFGAKSAGVKLVLCPQDNKKHLDKIKIKYPSLFDDHFKVVLISNLKEAVDTCLIHVDAENELCVV